MQNNIFTENNIFNLEILNLYTFTNSEKQKNIIAEKTANLYSSLTPENSDLSEQIASIKTQFEEKAQYYKEFLELTVTKNLSQIRLNSMIDNTYIKEKALALFNTTSSALKDFDVSKLELNSINSTDDLLNIITKGVNNPQLNKLLLNTKETMSIMSLLPLVDPKNNINTQTLKDNFKELFEVTKYDFITSSFEEDALDILSSKFKTKDDTIKEYIKKGKIAEANALDNQTQSLADLFKSMWNNTVSTSMKAFKVASC